MLRRLHDDQPESFAFTEANRKWAEEQVAKYPKGRQASAIIPLLWRAQRQHGGWLPRPAIEHVAQMLEMPFIRALEVATFYTMFNLAPVGRHLVQVCGTTPCMLRGSDDMIAVCKEKIGPEMTVRGDDMFSWVEVECLGACCNAPMVQIDDDYYEDLDRDSFTKILEAFEAGRKPKPGSQQGRRTSEPLGKLTTLTDPKVYEGSSAERGKKGNGDDQAPLKAGKPDPRAQEGAPALKEPKIAKHRSPELLQGARGGTADDLKKIKGIGPKLENRLNELGVYHFDQIAAWDDENVAWLDDKLQLRGRIERDDWIDQARALAKKS